MLCAKKGSVLTTSIASVDRELRNTDHHGNNSGVGEADMEIVTIFMNRGKGGYGFSVSGAKPTRVGRVEPGSAADQAGIEQWDSIVRINGQNVAHLDMITVAAIVKSCDRHILIDVQRDAAKLQKNSAKNNVHSHDGLQNVELQSQDGSIGGSSYFQDYSFDAGSDVTSYNTNRVPAVLGPWKRNANLSPWELYHQLKQKQAEILEDGDDTCSEYSYFTDTESSYSCSTFTADKENLPNAKMIRLSNSPPAQENSVLSVKCHSQRKPLSYCEVKRNRECDLDKSVLSSIRSCSPVNSDVSTFRPVTEKRGGDKQSGKSNRSQLSEDSGIELVSQLPVSYHNLSHDELKKQQLIRQLFDSEVAFRGQLRHGATHYLQPLEQGVVSAEQHAVLFQNIEKLLEMSSDLVKQIQASFVSYSDVLQSQHMDNLGSVMATRIDDLCEEYQRYCAGVKNSLTLFMELRKIRDFDRYVKKLQQDSDKPKLSTVLQKPVEHIKNVTLCVQKIYKLTDTDHSDYESLQEVVRALRRCSGNISQEYIRQSQSNLTTVTASTATLEESSPSVTSTSSVDSEVQDIQNRLLFGENVQPFHLANTSRHVIYTGDLEYESNSMFKKVHVILMNDVLLLTHKGADNFLTVLEKPTLLHDIKGYTHSPTNHPSEFQLKVECHHCETLGFEPKVYNFRATSLEQKCVWKNLLEQRINFIKTQRQFTQARVSELV